MQICFSLPRKKEKGRIYPDLKKFCFELPILEIDPRIPGPRPGPFVDLHNLATILTLTASLSERLPMRKELRDLASRALDAVVADLGDDVELHKTKKTSS